MNTVTIVLLVILVVLIAAVVVLYFLGRKAQKKQAEQQEQIEAYKQTVSMLIIDKKRMKLKDAGLPAAVIEQTPKLLRGSKLPIVKAKVGPQVMTLVCEESIFESVPVKKEVKATVSGIYITAVKGLHGTAIVKPTKKKGWFKRNVEKLQEKAGAKPLESKACSFLHMQNKWKRRMPLCGTSVVQNNSCRTAKYSGSCC